MKKPKPQKYALRLSCDGVPAPETEVITDDVGFEAKLRMRALVEERFPDQRGRFLPPVEFAMLSTGFDLETKTSFSAYEAFARRADGRWKKLAELRAEFREKGKIRKKTESCAVKGKFL